MINGNDDDDMMGYIDKCPCRDGDKDVMAWLARTDPIGTWGSLNCPQWVCVASPT